MKNWYEERKIPLLGFLAFLLIMAFLTIIFNWFWSGLGTDPTHYFRLPFTKNENEFKDYATLYVALLSFGASLFAGLVVFLVFTDWKDQHNKNIESSYYSEILSQVRTISNCIHEIKLVIDELGNNTESNYQIYANRYISLRKTYSNNLSTLQNHIIFIDLIQNNKELELKIFPFIKQAKEKIINDLDAKVLLALSEDELYSYIKGESNFHGELIKNNIKIIINTLHSKIKA